MSSEEKFPNLLYGRLWHTTCPVRFQMIITAGCILPNPPIPDRDRWKGNQGPDLYPYVRFLGGVSLFDFEGFDPESYSEDYPISSWRKFVPYRKTWGQAVWIEINRQKIVKGIISGEKLLAKWKQDEAGRHTIMPIIEAAHIGPIPLEAFSRVFRCGEDTAGFKEVRMHK